MFGAIRFARRGSSLIWLLVAMGALLCSAPPSATAATTWKMTLVARQCPAYTDVMANRARNDIQESLRDLGKDTVYRADGGQPISPDIEEPNQPNCTPIVGWEFKFGDGINGADTGPWGGLSKVRNPINHPGGLVTLASTPLLNSTGGRPATRSRARSRPPSPTRRRRSRNGAACGCRAVCQATRC